MTNRLLNNIHRLQEFILESGLARTVLGLPAPRTLLLPASTSDENSAISAFSISVVEPEIVNVSRDLFASGHYSLAVQEAYKSIDKFVGTKAGSNLTGTNLMNHAFSCNSPILSWTERKSQTEQDEQKGYQLLFSGAMLGIRNPVIHEFKWVEDPDIALELLIFAQHLLKKAKAAQKTT